MQKKFFSCTILISFISFSNFLYLEKIENLVFQIECCVRIQALRIYVQSHISKAERLALLVLFGVFEYISLPRIEWLFFDGEGDFVLR